jgi:hypothetical protein
VLAGNSAIKGFSIPGQISVNGSPTYLEVQDLKEIKRDLLASKILAINKNLVSSEAHSTGLCDVSKW